MKNEIKEQENKPLIDGKIGGFCYTAGVICVLIVSFFYALLGDTDSQLKIYLSYLLPCVALTLAIFVTLKCCNVPFKPTLKFYDFSFKKRYYAVIMLLSFGMLFGLGELNNMFIEFLSKFGYQEPQSSLPELSVWSVILCTLIIAVLPPILEEYLFRGLVMQGISTFSKVSAIFLTAFLFSIYHMSPAKTIYQFVVGVIFSFVCLKSGSLVPTVIIHFLNNLLIILDFYFGIFSFAQNAKILFTIIGLACILVAFIIMFSDKNKIFEKNEKKSSPLQFFMYSLGGILGCLFIWFASL